jgi:hypothetical protein
VTTRRRPFRKRQMGDCLELELSELGFEISLCSISRLRRSCSKRARFWRLISLVTAAALRRSSIVKTWAG